MEGSLNITQCILLADAGGKLVHHHPPAPGHEVSLGGHLTAGSVVVHLPDALDLPASPEADVGWRRHIQTWASKG